MIFSNNTSLKVLYFTEIQKTIKRSHISMLRTVATKERKQVRLPKCAKCMTKYAKLDLNVSQIFSVKLIEVLPID